jgi:methyl-accepting chemotaxis protein
MIKSFRNHRFRRTFLINKDLQYWLLYSSFFHIFLFLAVIGLALFTPLFIELGRRHGSSMPPGIEEAASVLLYLNANFWPAVLFAFLLIGLLSLRTSHRLAGPLNRITVILTSLKNGDLPRPIPVRKGDHLTGEVEAANQMLEQLRLQVGEIRKTQSSLHDAIVACSNAIGHASTGEIRELMNAIQEKESLIADKIDYFKVE